MDEIAAVFGRVAGLYKLVTAKLQETAGSLYCRGDVVLPLHRRYVTSIAQLKTVLPLLYGDLVPREEPILDADGDARRAALENIRDDLDYVLEVRANSNPGAPSEQVNQGRDAAADRVFLTHGRSPAWREVQAYLERDLGIPTLELAQEPNLGRTVLQKLEEEAKRCRYAVVVMTGDDEIPEAAPRARENVLHEIGYFQGRFGLENVCVLYEEGTNIPSNIHGLVYIPFPSGLISASFSALARELRAALAKV